MSISGLHGRAFFDPTSLSEGDAFAVCDRCGITYTMKNLTWQYDYRGNSLQNTKLLVCNQTCLDEPFEHYRPIIVPPDPMPILNARPGYYATQEGAAPPANYEQTLAQLID